MNSLTTILNAKLVSRDVPVVLITESKWFTSKN